jgi:hypothetical protein
MTLRGCLWALIDERSWRYVVGAFMGYSMGAMPYWERFAIATALLVIGSFFGVRDIRTGKRLELKGEPHGPIRTNTR